MIRIMLKRLQIPRHESKLRGWALNSVRRLVPLQSPLHL